MKRILVSVLLVLAVPATADYNPYRDNAIADVRLHIIDDEGAPVEGVKVTAAFYIGTTDMTKEYFGNSTQWHRQWLPIRLVRRWMQDGRRYYGCPQIQLACSV